MAYTISIPARKTYIRIQVTDVITVELARHFSQEARQWGIDHNLSRFLFDMRTVPNVETTLTNYLVAYEDMAQLKLSRVARSAILVSPDDQSHYIVETVTRNAGYNVRLFSDETAAVAWLEAGER